MLHLELIWKSLKSGYKLYLVWIVSLALAVSGILIVDVFRQSLVGTLRREGRNLLTADVSISSRREFRAPERAAIDQLEGERAWVSEILAMTIHGDKSRLSSVRFIDDDYPLYGDLEIKMDKPAQSEHGRDLRAQDAWVAPDLLPLLGIHLGEEIEIGKLKLRVAGTVFADPAQSFRFGSMAPRIYVKRSTLAHSGLLQFGSTFTQTIYFRLKTPQANLKKSLEAKLPDPEIQITVPEDLENGSFRILGRLLDFLGLIGLVTLSLGWIGIYYLGRRWLGLESSSVGALKCLGVSAKDLRLQLLLKLTIILLLGVLLGSLLATVLAGALLPLLSETLPSGFHLQWTLENTGLLLLVGPGLGALLLMPQILSLSEAPALELVNGEARLSARARDNFLFFATAAVLFGGLTLAQARSFKVAGVFLSALIAATLLLALCTRLLIALSARLRPRIQNWKLRATFSFWSTRKALCTLLVIVAGISGLLSELIPNLEKTLVGEVQAIRSGNRPSLFLIDIQDEQREPLEAKMRKLKVPVRMTAPFVRARVLSVNGQSYERAETGRFTTREAENDARFRNRGVNLSYRKTLSPYEKISEGKAWAEHSNRMDGIEVSVEQAYADRMGFKIGDKLKFDIQGIELEATIASLREVDWDSFEPNFFILFPDGVLNDAPKTWIMTVGRTQASDASTLQAKIAVDFPNVTSIDVNETLNQLASLLARMSGGLRIASGLALALGVFVMLMVLLFQLASSARDRIQLRLLGVRAKEIAILNLYCYGFLALAGLLVGAVLSFAVSFALARYAFESTLSPAWLVSFAIVAITSLAMALGILLLGFALGRRDTLAVLID